MDDGYIYDPWENEVLAPTSTVVDVLKDFIKTVYVKTLKKQEDDGLSDDEVVR